MIMTIATSNNTHQPTEQTYYFIIKGNVQMVGFRDRLEEMFINLGISSAIYNYDDGSVRVEVNTDDPEFIKKAILQVSDKIKKALNKDIVKDIEYYPLIEYLKLNKGLIPLPSKNMRVDINTLNDIANRLDLGVKYIGEIKANLEKMDNKLDVMNNKLDTMNNKLDRMNNKLDTLVELQKHSLDKLDTLIELQKEIVEILKNK